MRAYNRGIVFSGARSLRNIIASKRGNGKVTYFKTRVVHKNCISQVLPFFIADLLTLKNVLLVRMSAKGCINEAQRRVYAYQGGRWFEFLNKFIGASSLNLMQLFYGGVQGWNLRERCTRIIII